MTADALTVGTVRIDILARHADSEPIVVGSVDLPLVLTLGSGRYVSLDSDALLSAVEVAVEQLRHVFDAASTSAPPGD